ncbi:MAG: class I SAM-dependent methyltransferase [Leptolyngbyaceae cyanobacterium bins.59]|nr:class I SAM-dependent methyltransferase [Leptolyngbyaceae cyanobacterium bins.59]
MQWLTLNAKNRLAFALTHPAYALKVLTREATRADERFLAQITGVTVSAIQAYLKEPFQETKFLNHLQSCEITLRQVWSMGADLYAKSVLAQYALLRALKPALVVETGVANGVSSSYLLLAMAKNQKGHLHSIDIGDLGDAGFLPAGKSPGWVVPENLRSRWTLHIGDSKKLLKPVLMDLQKVDIFIHDSLHTYDHMLFEFQEAYPFVRQRGILIMDDVLWNNAFQDFAQSIQAQEYEIIRGIGLLKKG